MKTVLKPHTLGAFLTLLLFCSGATENSIRSRLPADVAMNKDAGRGNELVVMLRLESGEELLFGLDTGTAITSIDKSLEPKLGQRLDRINLINFGVYQEAGLYAAPKLYLGSTPLMRTGTKIITFDRKQLSSGFGLPVMGVLGMDVLQHYCIQLDFKAGVIRFLDDEHANRKGWGRAFPLTDIGDGCFIINTNFTGVKGPGSLIDTGCNYDGWLTSQSFDQWANQATPLKDGEARYPNAILDGATYHHVIHLHRLKAELVFSGDSHMNVNGIGLHFLARHLVTLDFPKRTMYLMRTSVEPLLPEGSKAALTSLKNLKKKGQVPGWPKDDKGAIYLEAFSYPDPKSVTFNLLKKVDSSIYHYTVARASKDTPWRLQKAWRTDQKGDTMEQYTVP